MRIENQQVYSNICYMPKKNESNNKVVSNEELVVKKEVSNPSYNNTTPNISENIVSHPIVYNTATLENSNPKLIDKQKDNIKSIAISGLSNNPLFSDSMKIYKGLIDVFSKIKSDINIYPTLSYPLLLHIFSKDIIQLN